MATTRSYLVDVPPPAAAAAPALLVGAQELELDHLLVAHLAVEVLAGELQVLVEPLQDHLGGEAALLPATVRMPRRELPEARHLAQLGLVVGERLLVRQGDRV